MQRRGLSPLSLSKGANHAVLGNIGSVRQIHLAGNIVRHDNSGIKLGIVDKRPAVNPNLHAHNRILQRYDRVDIPVLRLDFRKTKFGGLPGNTDLNIIA